jgi:hypothetical protein
MRLMQTAGLLALTLALGGCFQSTTVLHVNADRSGTIDQRSLFSTAALAQLRQVSATSGGESVQADPLSEDQARALAANIGPGVSYVSSTPVTTDAMKGRDTVYAFPDINTLRISQQPSAPGGLRVRAESLGPSQTITFALEPQADGHQLLRIHMPEITQLPGLPVQLPGAAAGSSLPGPTAEQIRAAAQMFAGMRLTVAVEPDGQVVKTNSPYVDGNRVMLFDLDVDQLVANPEALRNLQGARTPEEVQAVVKDLPGLKLTLAREVTIEFAPTR